MVECVRQNFPKWSPVRARQVQNVEFDLIGEEPVLETAIIYGNSKEEMCQKRGFDA